MKYLFVIGFFIASLLWLPGAIFAETAPTSYGIFWQENTDHILWYIDPRSHERAYIGSQLDLRDVINRFGKTVDSATLKQNPNPLIASILVEKGVRGSIWYINETGQRVYLGNHVSGWEVFKTIAPLKSSEELKTYNVSVRSPSWLQAPEGYASDIVAQRLPYARVLALDPAGHLVVSNTTRTGSIIALVDADHNGSFETHKTIIADLVYPHGVLFTNGRIYVATERAIYYWPYDPVKMETVGRSKTIAQLPSSTGLGFASEQGHRTRTLALGSDGMIYVSIGSSCDHCEGFTAEHALIRRMDLEGKQNEIVARGLRNTVFFTQQPATGVWWGNDMGQDNLGDNMPPDELNRLEWGSNFGWPYCYADKQPTPLNAHPELCTTTLSPAGRYGAHNAPLGMRFIPPEFSFENQGELLSSLHGSTVRSSRVGYKIVRFSFDKDNNPLGPADFITGFLHGQTIIGRPVDLIFDTNGNLYISDDWNNVVYRVKKR
ncbi:MAG: PQQ-dependent sugar dehydrogenase [Patescibacteria group bacterium]